MTAGMPNSRDSTAGCDVVPPVSVTSAGDLREQHDPRRVRHLADEDVAVADGVELVDRQHDARDPLGHARASRQSP